MLGQYRREPPLQIPVTVRPRHAMRLRVALGMLALLAACNGTSQNLRSPAVTSAAEPGAGDSRGIPLPLKSGLDFTGAEVRAMQHDDFANPGMLWVSRGEKLWEERAGKDGKACATCHGDAKAAMKGVATRYPARLGSRVFNLEQRINLCHTGQQKAEPFPFESRELLAQTAFIGRQSRGEPIAIDEVKLEPTIEMGRKIFYERQGQLSLACAQCHNDNWDRQLAGSTVGQAHPTGYPIYRLEWQSLGSLQRRLRNCMVGMRAEPYAFGSPEFVALETFLMWRARRMKLETPAVRP